LGAIKHCVDAGLSPAVVVLGLFAVDVDGPLFGPALSSYVTCQAGPAASPICHYDGFQRSSMGDRVHLAAVIVLLPLQAPESHRADDLGQAPGRSKGEPQMKIAPLWRFVIGR
jgi:hypothetical protein